MGKGGKMISPEELNLYRRLKKKINEKMGPIISGDRYAIEVLPRDWREEIEGTEDDNWKCKSIKLREVQGYNIIRLPLPIDPRNPERGLWGMIGDNIIELVSQRHFGDEISGYTLRYFSKDDPYKIQSQHESTPTLALLKALAEQEGV
jgi:hypothetical protein